MAHRLAFGGVFLRSNRCAVRRIEFKLLGGHHFSGEDKTPGRGAIPKRAEC